MTILCFGGGSDMAKALDARGVVRLPKGACDVRDFAAVKRATKKYRPDVVINFAGVSKPATVQGSSLRAWQDEIATNLIGSYHVAKAAVTHGVKKIILIGSVAGLYGKANHSGYCASKTGVIRLVQSLGMEGHAAYAISPGRVDTKMRERDYPGEDRRTRLTTRQIVTVINRIIAGAYAPGDNVIIRKRGYTTFRRIDKGSPWKTYLNVQPSPAAKRTR